MDLNFSKEQEMLRKSVAEFLKKECPFETVKEIEESEDGYIRKHWKKMAELGWMEVPFPEEYGGYDGPLMDIVIIAEEMGKSAFPSPYLPTVVMCGLTILEAGSEKQKKELAPKIASGKLIMALAQYEEEASYLESGINMSAETSGDGYALNGVKMFVTDANIADKIIVAARLKNKGVTLFLVDCKAPGITCSKMPAVGMDNVCEVIFQDVHASKDDVIGDPGGGWRILEKINAKAILPKCAEMLGGCKTVLDMTVEYAKRRIQYKKPIGSFQVIQHYLANMAMGYDTALNFLYKVCWMADEGMDVAKETHALKAHVNELYKFISERGVHIHGGIGLTREYGAALFYRRAKASEYVLGDTDHHHEQLAIALGM